MFLWLKTFFVWINNVLGKEGKSKYSEVVLGACCWWKDNFYMDLLNANAWVFFHNINFRTNALIYIIMYFYI